MPSINLRGFLMLGGVVAGAVICNVKPAAAQARLVIEVGAEPPPRIETYPHTYYDDRDVYWAHGHWYYRRAGRWYYYRDEPRPLRHHRRVAYKRHPHRHVHEAYREQRPAYHHHAHRRQHREPHRHVLVVR